MKKLPIKHIANLANLSLSEKELAHFEQQLGSTIEYMQQINQLDTGSASPTARVFNDANVLREDRTTASLTQVEALKNASRQHQGYFVVDAILDKE
ncbi:MAG: Asp-tRNA(Asn)/Glu-tRNA(Gln) amidotransferase subunit GatC [Patescibacteria group bacterium]